MAAVIEDRASADTSARHPSQPSPRSRSALVLGSIATLLIGGLAGATMTLWAAGPVGDALLVAAALGILLRWPYGIPAWASLTVTGGIASAILAGNHAIAENLAALTTYCIAVSILWATWDLALEPLGWILPLPALVSTLRLCRGNPAPAGGAPVDSAQRLSGRSETIVGILAGAVLIAAAWVNSGIPARLLIEHIAPDTAHHLRAASPVLVAALPTPIPTPTPPATCVAPASTIAAVGFDPYAILSQRRPDVLAFYAANGWNPVTQCRQIYDNWLGNGAGEGRPITAPAYVRAHGWSNGAPEPTPTPLPGCHAAPDEVARLGFDPYALLALHRPDVLDLYRANGWDPATRCVAIFDDWLRHPDGKPATAATQFVIAEGWARQPAPSPTPGLPEPPAHATPAAPAAPTA